MNVGRKNALVVTLGLVVSLANAPLPSAGQAQQSGSPHAISLYNLGLTAYKQGSPESAIIFFKRACDIDPNLADAQYNLGVLYQSQKRLKEAVPRFQEVLRVKPNDPDAHYQLALCLSDLGQGQDAVAHLAAIPPNNPHYAESQRKMQQISSGNPSISTPMQPPATPNPPITYQTQPAQNAPETSAMNPPPSQTTTQTYSTMPGQPNQTVYVQPTQPAYAQPAQQYTQPAQPYQTPSDAVVSVPVTPPPKPSASSPVPLIANAQVRVIATGFSAPSGLGFDRSGNLYVANFTNNTIDRIAADGSRSQFASGTNLKGPIGLVVDGAGNVYVANYTSGTVARISPAGICSIIAKDFRKPYYLTLDKDANLFVSQQEDNSIVRISLPRSVGLRPQ